jgi:hypothetical protein
LSENQDKYWKLKPSPPPAEDELCSCVGDPAIALQPHLSSNPLACIRCNLEVSPERIGFAEALAEEIRFWQDFHDCFYHLWLDSGEFESWARAQLENPASPVNTRGMEVARKLNQYRRTYYWWFQASGAADFVPHKRCPVCGGSFQERDELRICEECSVVLPL